MLLSGCVPRSLTGKKVNISKRFEVQRPGCLQRAAWLLVGGSISSFIALATLGCFNDEVGQPSVTC